MVLLRKYLFFCFQLLILLACKNQDSGQITFWAMGSEGKSVKPIIADFEKQNPEIKVKIQTIPWGAAHEKLLTAYAGNSTPDVCQLGNTWIPEFYAMKALVALDSLIDKSKEISGQNYFNGIWNTNILNKKPWGIPWYVDTRVLFYRTDIFRDAGLKHAPQTWDEWLAAARLLKKNFGNRIKYPLYFSLIANDGYVPVMLIMANSGRFLKEKNSRAAFDDPRTMEALRFYLGFFDENLASKSMTEFSNIYQGFEQTDFVMMVHGPWVANELLKRSKGVPNWSCALMPAKVNRASLAGGSSLVIFSNSKKKKAAWKLIEYLSSIKAQVNFYKRTHDLPAVKKAWLALDIDHDSILQTFYDQMENAAAPPAIAEWEQIYVKLQESLEKVIQKKINLNQAIMQLNRDVDLILNKRRWMLEKGYLEN